MDDGIEPALYGFSLTEKSPISGETLLEIAHVNYTQEESNEENPT
jgi:hypothetical protein